MDKKSAISVFSEDEVILREGESCGEMFKIISGNAALYLHYGEENEYFIGVLSEGKCFGEVSLLAGKPSPYTVTAVDNVMVMRVSAEQFEGFIRDNTRNAVDIMKNMASRIVMLNANLDMISEELSDSLKKSEEIRREPEIEDITRKIKMYQIIGMTGGEFSGKA